MGTDEDLPPELAQEVDDTVGRMRAEQEVADRVTLLAVEVATRDLRAEVARLEDEVAEVRTRLAKVSSGWRSAHEMHSRHHWCIDRLERTRPFKIGERCPTLEALESGRAVTP